MSYSYFSAESLIALVLSGTILLSSVLTFRSKTRLSIALLLLGSLGMGYFIGTLDDFLILWDEQYHALVAKNLSKDFFTPVLLANPVLDFDYRNWTENHVWLHKQPLFLWQMAISIKLLGTNELAVRAPSIIMHAITPLFIYRIGKMAMNKEVGYYGALLFAVAYFPLELVAGRFSTDHNDVAFLFYVTASIWAWFEYHRSQKKRWLIAIGLFAGCAVLVKWLMGLLVYVIWTVSNSLLHLRDGFRLKPFIPILQSGVVSLLVFLPWQIYAYLNFPVEASYEMQLNSKHFFEAVEGHHETTLYHFTKGLNKIYGNGDAVPFILLAGVILLVINLRKRSHQLFVAIIIPFVYLFYTAASTKMVSFPIIVAPFIYLGLGMLIFSVIQWIRPRIKNAFFGKAIGNLLLILTAFATLNLEKIQKSHTDWQPHDNHQRSAEKAEKRLILELDKKLNHEDYVIFNASITPNGHIPIMFYTDYTAYQHVPTRDELEIVRKKGKKIAILDNGNLPKHILNDNQIFVLAP